MKLLTKHDVEVIEVFKCINYQEYKGGKFEYFLEIIIFKKFKKRINILYNSNLMCLLLNSMDTRNVIFSDFATMVYEKIVTQKI